jgi:ABC-type amino acid transport substrate-binding protein
MASEIEGRTALAVSGLSGEIDMLERPLATESLAAVVSKNHPNAGAVIERINAALAKVKANGGYYSLVDKHLVALWGAAPATR